MREEEKIERDNKMKRGRDRQIEMGGRWERKSVERR